MLHIYFIYFNSNKAECANRTKLKTINQKQMGGKIDINWFRKKMTIRGGGGGGVCWDNLSGIYF